MPGPPELILILIIVLIVFGAGKLPDVGAALGKGISNFKKATSEKDEIDITPASERLSPQADEVDAEIEEGSV